MASEDAVQAGHAYRQLLREYLGRSMKQNELAGEEDWVEPPPFGEVRSLLRNEPRWKAVDSMETRQRLYAEAVAETSRKWLQVRKRKVEDATDLLELRSKTHRVDSEADFRTVITKAMKSPLDVACWDEARVMLMGVNIPGNLDEAVQQRIFNEFRQTLIKQQCDCFTEALRRAPLDKVGPELSFEQAKKALLSSSHSGGLKAERLSNVPKKDLRQAWEIWRRARLIEAKDAFRAFLRQCGHLYEVAQDSEAQCGRGSSFETLCNTLSSDEHYRRLDAVPAERRRMIAARLSKAATERDAARGTIELADDD